MNLKTKLILIEGLPGSGKSTTNHWLENQLRHKGLSVNRIHEADTPHPLWVGTIEGTQFSLPDFANTNPEALIETNLNKWRQFVVTIQASESITLVESYPFLNAMGIFLWGDIERDLLLAYGRSVHKIIKPLNPALIYLHHTSVAANWRRTCHIRGEAFKKLFTTRMETKPYCQNRQLKGEDCVLALQTVTHELAQQLMSEYTISQLAIDNSAGEWERYQQKVLAFLQDMG